MSTTKRALDRVREDVGELIASHEGGLSLGAFERYRDRPVAFQRDVLGLDPWSAQIKMAESVRDEPRTVVLGANGVGKDFEAASLALWWVYARRGLVLVTASAERTAGGVFMRREVAPQFRAAEALKGELYAMRLDVPGGGGAGIEAMTSVSAAKIAGFHHGPGTLVILSEANDVPDFAWEALLGGTAVGERDRVLAVGNPLAPEGRFHVVSRAAHWSLIRIPAADHPNVTEDREVIPGGPTRGWIDTMRREWGKDSPQFVARVEARFPENAEDAAFTHDHRDAAVDLYRDRPFGLMVERSRLVLAVDVAGAGLNPDRSALCVRRGPRVLEFHQWKGLDTRGVASRVEQEVRRLSEEVTGVRLVYVDTVGPGGPGVYDRLKEILPEIRYEYRDDRFRTRTGRPEVREFRASWKATDPERFRDAKSECFHRLRRKLDEGEMAIPPDKGLWDELFAHRLRHRPDGRIEVGAKDDVRRRLGRSPDLADALTMTLYAELEEAQKRRVRWKSY